jgi:hypothetical protein
MGSLQSVLEALSNLSFNTALDVVTVATHITDDKTGI